MRIEGAVGLVTGGASGLGEAVVRMLADAGARAAILDRPESNGQALADELGRAAAFFPTDVSSSEAVEVAVRGAADRFGRLDATVNCAGIAPVQEVLGGDAEPNSLSLFRRAVDVNLIGLFDVVRWSARYMSRNHPGADGERGLIVNIASIAGYEGQVGQAAYAATKGAVIARDAAARAGAGVVRHPGDGDRARDDGHADARSCRRSAPSGADRAARVPPPPGPPDGTGPDGGAVDGDHVPQRRGRAARRRRSPRAGQPRLIGFEVPNEFGGPGPNGFRFNTVIDEKVAYTCAGSRRWSWN